MRNPLWGCGVLCIIAPLGNKMIIRKYTPQDAKQIDEIYERCYKGTFGRPNLNHVLSAAVMESSDGKIVGFGALEAILEAVMIIDIDNLSVLERLEVLRQLLAAAELICKTKGFERFYMFPSDEIFKNALINRFGMNPCSPLLSCELDRNEVKKDGK